MCDARARLPKIKNIHPKPTDTSSQQQASRNGLSQHLIPCRASHRNTPLNPLSRGENITLKPLITKQKAVFKSPLLRGAGVCDVCAQLPEIKNIHLKPTDTSSQQQAFRNGLSQHPIPCRASHHHTPLNPLSRGESYNTTNLSLPTRKQHLKSPLLRKKIAGSPSSNYIKIYFYFPPEMIIFVLLIWLIR